MTNEMPAIILRPRKLNNILLLLGCLVFVIAGIMMGRSGQWIGYLCSAFFALGIPVAIFNMLPGFSQLEINSEGFTITVFFRKDFIPWSALDRFRIIDVTPMSWSKTKRVGFDWLHPNDQASQGQKFSKFLAGAEGMLPDNYGKKAEELLEIMNTYLAKAKKQQNENHVV